MSPACCRVAATTLTAARRTPSIANSWLSLHHLRDDDVRVMSDDLARRALRSGVASEVDLNIAAPVTADPREWDGVRRVLTEPDGY
jgi:hypothetical protein